MKNFEVLFDKLGVIGWETIDHEDVANDIIDGVTKLTVESLSTEPEDMVTVSMIIAGLLSVIDEMKND